ncbi:hypothetical protein AVEN_12431-1 [Araneus ventricosus]|uniref:Uncharacterized protein n=1 Tax=Araneus ventricosus TaxID=182803 RepID=A0A4Y2X4Z7_ARAVE|nr:hypothetical protein AVEN_12431-1 [Araneus ventricosus]
MEALFLRSSYSSSQHDDFGIQLHSENNLICRSKFDNLKNPPWLCVGFIIDFSVRRPTQMSQTDLITTHANEADLNMERSFLLFSKYFPK